MWIGWSRGRLLKASQASRSGSICAIGSSLIDRHCGTHYLRARLPSRKDSLMTRELLPGVTGVLALADGTVLQGLGVGAVGEAVGEVCFNTAMTGYQEILTDPSYMAQIVAFTFPHVGNVGTNLEDLEQISG